MNRKNDMPMTDPELEKLGCEISSLVQWSGEDIFRIAHAAFEDAHFHTFSEKFRKLWNEETDGDPVSF